MCRWPASGAAVCIVIVAGQRLPILSATKPVDFRCGHKALALIVQAELRLDPHSAITLVFRSKRGDRFKSLVWDGSGMVRIYKVPEQGSFVWPKVQGGVMRLPRARSNLVRTGGALRKLLETAPPPAYVCNKQATGGPMAKTNPFQFMQQVRAETAKVTWPTRREVVITTLMVLAMAALTAVFFFLVDLLIRTGLGGLLGMFG